MSNALDHVRNNCGIAGEEVAEMVYALEDQLATVTKERDSQQREWSKAYDIGVLALHRLSVLEAFVKRIAALPPHGEYVTLIDEANAALAKLGADKGE